MSTTAETQGLVTRLRAAGCVAAEEEAIELEAAAAGDDHLLEGLLSQRVSGLPLAWVTGSVVFAGLRIVIHPGVYVPRHQTAALAHRALELLPEGGLAVDLCTGSGAVAAVLAVGRPSARVIASEIDPNACLCAAANGVEVYCGDLDGPLPTGIPGAVDIVTVVAPYVPTAALAYLPRESREHEPLRALCGGSDGTAVLAAAVAAAGRLLREGGHLLLELGAGQPEQIAKDLARHGFVAMRHLLDEEGDVRAVEAWRAP